MPSTAAIDGRLRRPATPAPGVICLFSDLTAVVELEEQLRLKETLARLGELTAGLAHEFRNGLATIHGYSRLIDVEALPPKYRPYVEGIRQEAEALGKVVTNFLSFARPENVVLSPVDLGVIARRAADDLRNELPAGTSLTVDGTFGRCSATTCCCGRCLEISFGTPPTRAKESYKDNFYKFIDPNSLHG